MTREHYILDADNNVIGVWGPAQSMNGSDPPLTDTIVSLRRERDEARAEIERLKDESNQRVCKLLAQIVVMGDRIKRLEAEIAPMRMETLRKDP